MGKKGPLWWRESDWLLRGSSAANQILLRHSGPLLSNVTKTHLASSSLSLAPHWSVPHWTWGPDQTSASHWTWVPGLTWVPDWTSVLHWSQFQPWWSMAAHLQ